MTLDKESYDFFIEALQANENDYEGIVAENAKALREKIEKYGRSEPSGDGDDKIRLCFFENEGVKLIGQFLAAAQVAKAHRNL